MFEQILLMRVAALLNSIDRLEELICNKTFTSDWHRINNEIKTRNEQLDRLMLIAESKNINFEELESWKTENQKAIHQKQTYLASLRP